MNNKNMNSHKIFRIYLFYFFAFFFCLNSHINNGSVFFFLNFCVSIKVEYLSNTRIKNRYVYELHANVCKTNFLVIQL